MNFRVVPLKNWMKYPSRMHESVKKLNSKEEDLLSKIIPREAWREAFYAVRKPLINELPYHEFLYSKGNTFFRYQGIWYYKNNSQFEGGWFDIYGPFSLTETVYPTEKEWRAWKECGYLFSLREHRRFSWWDFQSQLKRVTRSAVKFKIKFNEHQKETYLT